MSLVLFLCLDWDLHPPSSTFGAFPEGKLVIVLFEINDVFQEAICRNGVVALALVEAKDEVPDHLGNQCGRLLSLVVFRPVAIKSDGGQFVAQSGVATDLAGFFGKQTAGAGLQDGGRLRRTNAFDVERQQVGISDQGFCLLDVFADVAQAKMLEVVLLKGIDGGLRDVVTLVGEQSEVEDLGLSTVEDVVEQSRLVVGGSGQGNVLVHDHQIGQLLFGLIGQVLGHRLVGMIANDDGKDAADQQFAQDWNEKRDVFFARIAQVDDFERLKRMVQAIQLISHGIGTLTADADEGELNFGEIGKLIVVKNDSFAELMVGEMCKIAKLPLL